MDWCVVSASAPTMKSEREEQQIVSAAQASLESLEWETVHQMCPQHVSAC